MSAEREKRTPPGKQAERAVMALVCAAVAWFYAWTVRTSSAPWNFGAEQADYYNLLIDGWLAGQLHLKVDVPPELLAVADPYDPAQRPPGVGLHDASFYRGKYFLYFGVAPVLTLMWPFRAVTGVDLPLPAAILCFAFAGFLVSARLVAAIRSRYFPNVGVAALAAAVATLGVASMVPLLLRRPSIWELPLSSGYFFAMLAVACVYRSLHAARGELRWLAGASLSLGLAVASKPTYLFAGLLLVVPVVWRLWTLRGAPTRVSETLRIATAAFVPVALIGLGLACYNYARFGNPTEFGVRYLFSGIYEGRARHFGLDYLAYNLRLYFFQPAAWSWYFPFIRPTPPPPFPPDYFGFEFVFGLLVNVPLLWFAAALPLAWKQSATSERCALRVFLAAASGMATGMTLILAIFYAAMGRYQSDFAPTLMLLATIGALAFAARLQAAGRFAALAGKTFLGAALAFSVLFGVVASFELYGNLQRAQPEVYARIARVTNYPGWWRERLVGTEHGPIELEVRLPERWRAPREVLLATGSFGAADVVFLEEQPGGNFRVGFRHSGGSETLSRALPRDATRPRRLRIELGSLLPPENHPFYSGEREALRALTRRLVVEDDDDVVLEGYQRFHPALSAEPELANSAAAVLAGMPAFSGEIITRRRDADYARLASQRTERLIQRVHFASGADAKPQPLFAEVTADPAMGVCTVHGSDSVRLGVLAAEGALLGFPAVTIDPAATHEIEWVSITSTGERAAKLVAKLDGVPLGTWRGSRAIVLGGAQSGVAPPGRADTLPRFPGTLHHSEYVAGERRAEFAAVRLGLVFPAGEKGRRDPLVVTGETGRGDQFFVEYLEANRVRFGLDHWGKPPRVSEPLELSRADAHELILVLGSFPRAGRISDAKQLQAVKVFLDGRLVWATENRLYSVEAREVFIARNPIGGTTCEPAFAGSVLGVEYLSEVP